MIYRKELLASLVLDVVKAYRLLVTTQHPERVKQMHRLESLCQDLNFDIALKSSVMTLIQDIEKQARGFFTQRTSLLATMLKDAVDAYDCLTQEAIIFEEQFPNQVGTQAHQISHQEILQRSQRLYQDNQFAIT